MSYIAAVHRYIDNFFWAPASPKPLAAFRMSVAFVLITQGLSVSGDILNLLGSSALVQQNLAVHLDNAFLPSIAPLLSALKSWGVSEFHTIAGVCLLYLTALILLLIGWKTHLAAGASWLFHTTLINSSAVSNYGLDIFAHVALFYLIWMPSGHVWSVDARTKNHPEQEPIARLGLRVLQLHLCIVYLTSGLEKAQGEQWWNGEVIWRSLMLPVYAQYDMSWIAQFPWTCKLAAWGSLLLEIGYCVFIWPKATRKFWVAGIIGLHFGIGLFLGLKFFSAMMIAFTACAFGISAQVQPTRALSKRSLTVFFDGDCAACNAWVRFILQRDVRGEFSFGPLQGRVAQSVLGKGIALSSIILIENDKRLTQSDAVLRILHLLGFPWLLAGGFKLVPRFLRDAAYSFFAQNRRSISGALQCRLLSISEQSRILA